jgi:O-antigen/teichoic acid export membrane protein
VSLRANIAANYASQIYTTLIGIALVPLYLKYMGSEAYGLVGFFAMLQAWFGVLDLGLTPTIARESARYHGGGISALDYRRVFRAMSMLFASVALCGGLLLVFLAEPIALHWLKVTVLPMSEVVLAVQVMAACVALRWMGGLYRGVVSGSERLVWLSGFNAAIATIRFAGVFLSMWWWGFNVVVFFWHQLLVAGLECIGLVWATYRLLPSSGRLRGRVGWSIAPVRPLVRFAITIAFTSTVWVLVTQTDKLILSGVLTLAEYGYFSVAVLVASSITLITGPISSSIMPRMARLQAEGRDKEIHELYCKSTQLTAVVAGSIAVTLVVCAGPLLVAWTGDRRLAEAAVTTLQLYAIGNGLLAIGAFPYYLQYARGDLRYHLIGNLLMTLILIPAIVLAATRFGALGAGLVWVATNFLYLFFWVAYVHSQIFPRQHWPWLRDQVIKVVGPTALVGLTLAQLDVSSSGRPTLWVFVTGVALACCLTATIMADGLRTRLLKMARPYARS